MVTEDGAGPGIEGPASARPAMASVMAGAMMSAMAGRVGAGVALAIVCGLLFWTGLGAGPGAGPGAGLAAGGGGDRSGNGLAFTEGHRAIPGWELLADLRDGGVDDPRDLLVTRMFGQVYLRKPPGMPWAVAVSSAVFGINEFAARVPSALAMTLLVFTGFVVAGRWFGWRVALAGGLATALMPRLWSSARAAEIEALNTLGTTLAAVLVIAMMLALTRRARVWLGVGAGLAIVLMALAKGPAGAPVVVAAALGSAVALGGIRGWAAARRALVTVGWVPALAIPALVLGGLGWMTAVRVAELKGTVGGDPVLQGPGEFLWGEPLATLAFPLVAWIGAFPAALAVLFPFGDDARAEAERAGDAGGDERAIEALVRARALAWAFVIALLAYAAMGVSNPRYAMPAFGIAAPLVGYVVAGFLGARIGGGGALVFGPTRRRIAGAMLLGRVWVWPVVLVVGYFAAFRGWYEPERRGTTGYSAGVMLAEQIDGVLAGADGLRNGVVELRANEVVEARPETLWYAMRRLEALGWRVEARWVPGGVWEGGGAGPSGGGAADRAVRRVLVVREIEREAAESAGWVAAGGPIGVHRYEVWWMVDGERAGAGVGAE